MTNCPSSLDGPVNVAYSRLCDRMTFSIQLRNCRLRAVLETSLPPISGQMPLSLVFLRFVLDLVDILPVLKLPCCALVNVVRTKIARKYAPRALFFFTRTGSCRTDCRPLTVCCFACQASACTVYRASRAFFPVMQV